MNNNRTFLKIIAHCFIISTLIAPILVYSIYINDTLAIISSALLICLFLGVQIRILTTSFILLLDKIGKRYVTQNLQLLTIKQNIEVAGMTPKRPTIFDLFSSNPSKLINIMCSDSENNKIKLKYFSDTNHYNLKLSGIVAEIIQGYKSLYYRLKVKEGECAVLVTYYKKSRVIKNIIVGKKNIEIAKAC